MGKYMNWNIVIIQKQNKSIHLILTIYFLVPNLNGYYFACIRSCITPHHP